MADNEVIVTMSAQDASMVAAWQRQRQLVKDTEKAYGGLGKTGQSAGQQIAGAFKTEFLSAFTGRLAATRTLMQSIGYAAQLFRQEWDEILQRQQKAASAQADVNAAFRRAAMQAGDVSPDSLFRQVVGGARGVDPKELFLTFEAATSAAGDMSKQKVLDSVLATAKLRPDLDLQSRSALTTGALQLQKEFGGNVEQSMAAVQQSFTTSRAENLQAFAKNVIPTVVALRQMGGGKDSFEDLMGLSVGFGLATNDPTGERGRTNLINLAKQLKQQGVGAGLVGQDASIMETLAAVQKNKPLQQQLLGAFAQNELGSTPSRLGGRTGVKGELSTEAAVFQAAVDLVSGKADSAMMREMRSARDRNLGISSAALADVEGRSSAIAKSRFSNVAEIEKVGRQGLAESQLLTPLGSLGAAQKLVAEMQKEMGVNAMGRQAASIAMQIGAGSRKTDEADFTGMARAVLASEMQRIRRGEIGVGDMTITAGDREAAEKMQTVIDRLDELIEVQKAQREQPTKVTIEGDTRQPAQPRKPPARALRD
jgi:hypothetical protein